jgi:hypothetical protein
MPISCFHFPQREEDQATPRAQQPLTARTLVQEFLLSTMFSEARFLELRQRGYSVRAARNFLLNSFKVHLYGYLGVQTPRFLLDLITELGLICQLKALLRFLQVTHKKKKVGQIPCSERRKICEFFYTDPTKPIRNSYIGCCAVVKLMDCPDAAFTEQELNQRKAILEIMKKSCLRHDIQLYLQARHQIYLRNTNDIFSPTQDLFLQSFDWYCMHFAWFVIMNTHIRNHQRPVAADPVPESEPEQPPSIEFA